MNIRFKENMFLLSLTLAAIITNKIFTFKIKVSKTGFISFLSRFVYFM